jgi:hypothetical protein
MKNENVYKAPSSNLTNRNSFTWEGDLVKVESPAVFPKVCVRCSEAADLEESTTKLNYVNPLTLLWLLLSPLALIIAYYVFRKRAEVTYSLCGKCAEKSGKWELIAKVSWIVFISAILIRIIVGKQFIAVQAFFIVGSLLLALFASAMKDPQLSATKFSNPFFYIKGFGKKFIEKSKSANL